MTFYVFLSCCTRFLEHCHGPRNDFVVGGKGQLHKICKYTKYTLYTRGLGPSSIADKRFGAF